MCELNMVRTQPQRYAGFVREYAQKIARQPRKIPRFESVHVRYIYNQWNEIEELSHDTIWINPNSHYDVKVDSLLLLDIKELLAFLEVQPPVGLVKPNACLGQSAAEQGVYCREIGLLQHTSRKNEDIDKRLLGYCTNAIYGAEAITGGAESIRQSVINLLIDAGLPTRNHRKVLLDANTKFAGTYFAGVVGEFKNTWMLNFCYY